MSRRVALDTTEYERSHCCKPKGRGAWILRTDDGGEITKCGTLTEIRHELPAGSYVLLP